jgi:DNA-binding NarL/FixJ family response regulator
VAVRILLADDSPELLAAVREVLDAATGFTVVATASSGDEAVGAAREHSPDLVVIDIEMPGGGPGLVPRLRELSPVPRVMVLSARDDELTVLDMLAAGATGYVAKGALDEDLASCVRSVADGSLVVVADCAGRVRARLDGSAADPLILGRMH